MAFCGFYNRNMRVPNKSPEIEKMGSMEEMLQENLKKTQEIYGMVKKINRHILWQKVWGWTKFFLILIPLIFAVIYLPVYIKKGYEIYQQILKSLPGGQGMDTFKNIGGLIKQLQDLSGQVTPYIDKIKQ